MNDDLMKISDALWSEFEPFLVKEVPVYFTFTRKRVSRIIADAYELVDIDEAFNVYLKSAKSLMDINENNVRIKTETYKIVSGEKRSSVILLIAMQILAVELMSDQGSEYSAHAYYPRLRSLISDDLTLDTSLPFDPGEFEAMWSCFAKEVSSYYTKEAVITFDIEAIKSFKNKIRPLSQALLTHSDLAKLGLLFHETEKGVDLKQFDFDYFFRKHKGDLSRRGRECLSKNLIRPAIIEQFFNFVETTPLDSLKLIEEESLKIKDSFSVDLRLEEDPFENFYEYKLKFRTLDSDIGDLEGHRKLVEYIDSKGYLALMKNLDYFTGGNDFSKKVEFKYLSFLIINEKNINLIETSLDINNLNYKLHEIGINKLKVMQVDDERVNDKIVSIFKGRLQKGVQKSSVVFEGGIRLSENGYSFLKGYHPNNLFINGTLINDNDVIQLNNEVTSWGSLKEKLSSNELSEYNFICMEEKIRLRIESPLNSKIKPIGNKVYDEKVDVAVSECDFVDKFISGFKLNNIYKLSDISQRDFLLFLTDIEEELVQVDAVTIVKVEESIENSTHLGKTHKRYLKLRLRQTGRIPLLLSQRLAA